MIEQIERLEQRIEKLVQGLEQSRQRIQLLEKENQGLYAQIEEMEKAQGNNDALKEQVRRLEDEIESMTNRDSQIRGRLHQILEKIDFIEQEARGGGS